MKRLEAKVNFSTVKQDILDSIKDIPGDDSFRYYVLDLERYYPDILVFKTLAEAKEDFAIKNGTGVIVYGKCVYNDIDYVESEE